VLSLVAIVTAALFLIPDSAHAWGPISHLAHGSEVLKGVTILGVGLQQLLKRFPTEYLYGCIGADITLGKKYTGPLQAHCHSWEVGWQLVDEADSDSERAFAYGYLSHLAADVYSHNHFVPTQLVVSYHSRTLRHIYWEARFDSMQDAEYREIVRDLRQRAFPECDALVERVVARTLFSFRTNKRIFENFLALHDWDNWHRFMARVSNRSRHNFPEDFVAEYNSACQENILDLLRRGKRADCQAADPTGLEAISTASRLRRTLKALQRRNAITPELEEQLQELNRRADLRSFLVSDDSAATMATA
jgi:hypothetical protein